MNDSFDVITPRSPRKDPAAQLAVQLAQCIDLMNDADEMAAKSAGKEAIKKRFGKEFERWNAQRERIEADLVDTQALCPRAAVAQLMVGLDAISAKDVANLSDNELETARKVMRSAFNFLLSTADANVTRDIMKATSGYYRR